jgi:hypothetical protein
MAGRVAYRGLMTFNIRPAALALCLATLYAQTTLAQGEIRYREFVMGSDIATVAKLAGAAPSTAKIVHARPVLLQDLEWRPRYYSLGAAQLTDPVDVMVFKFYDGRLFTIVADYDRRRTEGMSAADMIEAISATYGPVTQVPSRPIGSQMTPIPQYGFPDTPLAVWGNAEYSVTLMRVTYPASYRLVVAHTAVETLARAASAEAVRMDTSEAPDREIERQKKDAAAIAAAQDKAKNENKAQFRP